MEILITPQSMGVSILYIHLELFSSLLKGPFTLFLIVIFCSTLLMNFTIQPFKTTRPIPVTVVDLKISSIRNLLYHIPYVDIR